MSPFLSSLLEFLTRDLSGRTWEIRKSHPYFGEMIYYGSKDPEACYWEAELDVPGQPKRIGVAMRGTEDGPEPSEEAFCKELLADVDALFEKCQLAFEPVFARWTKQPFPAVWREAFVLDGIDIPAGGQPNGEWCIYYFVEPAGHYFTALFESGKVTDVLVDG